MRHGTSAGSWKVQLVHTHTRYHVRNKTNLHCPQHVVVVVELTVEPRNAESSVAVNLRARNHRLFTAELDPAFPRLRGASLRLLLRVHQVVPNKRKVPRLPHAMRRRFLQQPPGSPLPNTTLHVVAGA